MTTPLHHVIAAQDAVEAEGFARDDWQKVALKLACAVALANRAMSYAYIRAELYTEGELRKLRLDDQRPLGIEEEGT